MPRNMWARIAEEHGLELEDEFFWSLENRTFFCSIDGEDGFTIITGLEPGDSIVTLIGRFIAGKGIVIPSGVGLPDGSKYYTMIALRDLLEMRREANHLTFETDWSGCSFDKTAFVLGLVCGTRDEADKKAQLLYRTTRRYLKEGRSIIDWEALANDESLFLEREGLELNPSNVLAYRPKNKELK